jgi:hypothetical protein
MFRCWIFFLVLGAVSGCATSGYHCSSPLRPINAVSLRAVPNNGQEPVK